jgi:metal-responsive CopG/Arc/MetJ family transcriptional regulator
VARRSQGWRGPGRPPLPKSQKKRHVIPFKVDDAELREIDGKSKELRLSRSELIRLAIKKLIGRG